jgi:hypothetical protein
LKLEPREAVHILLSGRSFQEAADKYGVSAQTVRNRWRTFIQEAEREGLMSTSKEYGVVEQVNNLRTLSIDLKSNDLEIDDCKTGYRIATMLKELELSTEDMGSFLKNMILYAKTNNIPNVEMAGMAHSLHTALDKSGLDYEELVKEVDKLQDDKKTYTHELQNLKSEIDKTCEDLENRLAEASITEEKLDTYLNDKSALEKQNLLIENIADTSKVIKELKAQEFEAVRVINLVEEHDSLLDQVMFLGNERDELTDIKKNMEKENKSLQDNRDELIEDIGALRGQKDRLSKPIQALSDLNRNGLADEEILGLRDLVVEADYTVESFKAALKDIGGLRGLRVKHVEEVEVEEAKLGSLHKQVEYLEQDVADLNHRKKIIAEDTEKTINEFDSKIRLMFEDFDSRLYDSETGLKASFMDAVNSSLWEADIRVKGFTDETQRRLEAVKVEAGTVRDRYEKLEVKIRRFNAELSKYRFLEDFSKLLLGVEMPRGEKLRIVVSTLQLLEDTVNYMGLKGDAESIKMVKGNVFRNS